VLLVAFRLAPNVPADDPWNPLMHHTEQQLRTIAAERGIPIAPFPVSVISTEHWVDHCHLNGAGCRQKAQHIAEYVRKLFP